MKLFLGILAFIIWALMVMVLIMVGINFVLYIYTGYIKYDLPGWTYWYIVVSWFLVLVYTEVIVELD